MKPVVWGSLIVAAAAAAGVLYATGHLPPGRGSAATTPGAATGKSAATAASVAPAVSVVKVTTAGFVETVLITGSVVAREEVLIAPEIEGFRVESLAAEEGDTVTKGQILARLASDTLDAQLAQNEANIARADAAIAVARSGIVQAEASVKEANNAFERAKPLKQSGYVSGATFDQRESAASTAQSKLVSARDSLKSAEADKAVSEAQRKELAWKRSRSDIRSPVDGVISRRTARVGGVASAVNDAMFRIIANGEVELDAEVAESDMAKIREGQQAAISISGAGDVNGTVRLISSEVDRATRLGKVKVGFGVNPALRLGAFGHGSIVTAKSRGLSVPASAVVYASEGAIVQAIQDGRVVSRKVKTGLKTQTMIEVLDGLTEGDTIVAKSGSFLRDGDAVRPVIADTKVSGVPG